MKADAAELGHSRAIVSDLLSAANIDRISGFVSDHQWTIATGRMTELGRMDAYV